MFGEFQPVYPMSAELSARRLSYNGRLHCERIILETADERHELCSVGCRARRDEEE